MQLKELYGNAADAKAFSARVSALAEQFERLTGSAPEAWFSSSGRAEIIGNHTDHNHGRVIVAAIGCDILAAVKKREDGVIRISSAGFPSFELKVSDLAARPSEKGRSGGAGAGGGERNRRA